MFHGVLILTFAGLLLCSTAAQSTSSYTTTSQPKSNSHLEPIPYTKSCPKNLYDCGILSPYQKCHRGADAVYYASTSMADAFAMCLSPILYFAKIAFNDEKGDIDVIWFHAHFRCENNGWKYCRDGWCRPVRHFACYETGFNLQSF
ncbi:unnamed protein product [Cylicocyclus nassatus]|uniref:Uncharacterized protein n=1 Tax=Cylicocyclus nassatus TaxID=53992 RepID=A0AA36DLF8_CYLNA|nr:unnamed protein product [Cylicocyclus nassatus]